MAHDVVEDIIGRVGHLIYGQRVTYPSWSLYYVWKNLALQHGLIIKGQGIQKKKGALILRIDTILSKQDKKSVHIEAQKYFGHDINCEILDNKPPIRTKGKLKDFISFVDE